MKVPGRCVSLTPAFAPPSQHDIRYYPVQRHTGEKASSSNRGQPAAADPNPRVAAVIDLEAPIITLTPMHQSVSYTVPSPDGPVVWPQSRVDGASRVVTSYLRHGTKGTKSNC